jgi:hypothetical protein
VAGGVTAIHLVLVRGMVAPIIQPDELGYLGGARYLVGDGPPSGAPTYPGTSLLYVPAVLLRHAALDAFRGALVINAILCGVLALVAWALVPRLGVAVSTAPRAVIAATAALSPALLTYSSLAWSEVPLALAFAVSVLAASHAFRRPSPATAALFGASAAACVLIHPRGYAVVAAALIAAVVAWRPWHAGLARLLALAVVVAVGIGGTLLLAHAVAAEPQGAQYAVTPLLDRLTDPGLLRAAAIEVAGNLLYITAATFGLAVVGVATLAGAARGVRQRPVAAAAATALYVVLAFGLLLALSVLSLLHGARVDQVYYGRYVEVALPPLVIAGLGALVRPGRSTGRIVTATLLLLGVCALAIQALVGGDRLHAPTLLLVNVPGIAATSVRLGWPDPLIIAAVGATGLLLLERTSRTAPLLALIGAAVVFVAMGAYNDRQFVDPGSRQRGAEDAVGAQLNAIRARIGIPGACVAYDSTSASPFHRANYRLLVPVRFRDFVPGVSRPCGDLVISGRALDAVIPGARKLVAERGVAQALWVLPGPTLDRLAP